MAALGLLFCYYNFCRIHTSIRVTPCMAAGVTKAPWKVADLVALLPVETGAGKKRGSYKPRISN